MKGKALKNPVFTAEKEARSRCSVLKQSQKETKNTAQTIYEKVAPIFEKTYDMSFVETLSKVPDLNLQHKTKERIRDRRHHYRESKENIESQMAETAFLR